MENKFKIIASENCQYNTRLVEDEINCQYEKGWEFIQMLPQPSGGYWLYFKRIDAYHK